MRANYKLSRLYVEQDLSDGVEITISGNAYLHIVKVLRKKQGEDLRVFNGRDGEYKGELTQIDKRQAVIKLSCQLQPLHSVPDVEILFAPLKKDRMRFLVEKATELGVRRLRPVVTARSQYGIKPDKLMAYIIAAAEQSERLDLPEITAPQNLNKVVENCSERVIIFADENADQATSHQTRAVMQAAKPAVSILIGPEGGFDAGEREFLLAQPFVKPISLGKRIMRAETAAIATLALWQSLAGDWVK